ncbi:MAG TPA: PASTA domain-containing protein, partial [Vicinamibacterales bacterium]|nr:PASTA domain-containing protein [Vicinamibacterales bacterium]
MRLRLLGLAAFIAALSLSVPITSGAFLSGSWSGNAATPGDLAASLLPAQSGAARALGLRLTQGLGGAPAPVTIGNQIAGTFGDATGHSAQSHLVYAVNSHLWWLFTLTSANDSNGGTNHVVKAYVSSGPDLTTATWSAAADSPTAAAGSPNGALRGGRSLGVAYLNNSPTDVIHADISMAFDGQNGRTGHIRAVVTGTTIAWGTWNFWDEPAATWTLPHGNVVGVSSGRFIHTGGPILQQEVDANARRSANVDTGSTWSNGFSNPTVFDGTMKNQNNAMAFAPLANNVMLAVYDNGQGTEPTLTNLRYTKSNASGTWPAIVIGSQTGGNGDVFPTAAAIDQNDWGLAALDVNQIYVFRRKASGGGIDAASYNVAGNSWSPMSPAPPAFGQGQAAKAGVGVFAANDGVNVFVCVVNTDAANTILCARFDGAAWSAWTAIPGTDVGVQTRRSLSGSPQVGNGLVGLIWTEGASIFDIVTTSFVGAPDVVAPTVAITAPLDQAGATGTVSVTAMASDNVAVAGVQFKLDGADLGVEVTSAPYSLLWNTETAFNGTHTLTAIARDAAGNTTTAAAVSVTVTNLQTPIITWPPPARLVHGAALGPTQLNATANTPGTFVYTPAAGTILPLGLIQTLSTTFTPDNKTLFKTTTASVTIDVVMVVPDVVGQSQAIATTTLTQAGLTVGTVTQASSLTVPAGAVISQTPPGNTETGVVGPVDLVVSTGAVSVPNVVGLTQSAASAAITNASLTVGPVTSTSSTTVASGLVISHNPTAGTQVTAGSAVALVVSSGPPRVAVPNVVGLTQAAASTAITNAGLTVGTITTASSTTIPSGSVISENPTAGTQIATGSAVALVVSSGPPQATVPNVVGLTQAAASAAITNAGLVVGVVTNATSTTVAAGSVISQSPNAGVAVPTGSPIALLVSTGPPAPATLAIDKTVSVDGTGTVTTPPFSTTAANELLVLFATSAGPLSVSPKQTLAITSAGLTWTLAVRSNAQFGTAEVWTATAAAPITNGTVTSVQSVTNGYHQSLTLIAFTGSGGTGATAVTSASFGATSIALTATKAASVVYMAANDSARAVAHAVPADQVLTHQWVDTVAASTFWVQTLAAPVATPGTVTINNPTPTSDRWNAAAIEILVGAAPPPSTVPNVVGSTQTAATDAIVAAGLVVGSVTISAS